MMENNNPIVVIRGDNGRTSTLKDLALVRSMLYTGIVAIWFLRTYTSYWNYLNFRKKPTVINLQKKNTEATKE